MRYSTLILLFLTFFQFSYSQSSNSYPFSQDSILFNPITRKTNKPIPFDKPFIIVVDKIDLKKITAVYAYEVAYTDGVRELVVNAKDAQGRPLLLPNSIIRFDTSSNKLILFFPAYKPLVNFDINIQSAFSDKYLDLFYKVIKDIYSGEDQKSRVDQDALQAKFIQTDYPHTRRSLYFVDLSEFNTQIYDPVKPEVDAILNNAGYSVCATITDAEIKHAYNLLEWTKNKCDQLPFLNFFHSTALPDITLGLISLSDENKFETVGKFSFNERVFDFKKSISIMDSVDSCLLPLYLQTLDNDIKILYDKVHSNNISLKDNLKNFQKHLEEINKVINAHGFVSGWLEGSSDANDLKTKSASLISTDLGITNIFIKDNLDNNKYIPKIFLGLNIFFRPVDRNVSLKYLSGSTKDLKRDDDVYDNLSATRTILQHLSLSVGVTFGTINVTNFDNLFNTMSLVVGPSYRFARAFRITSGVAVLRRTNPNPVFTNEVVTAGFFVSLSVDFDFLSSVKNFTDIITK